MELSRKTIISAIVIEVVVLITGAIALGYMAFQSGRAAEIVNDGEATYCLVATGMIGDSVSYASPEQQGDLTIIARPDGGVEILKKCSE